MIKFIVFRLFFFVRVVLGLRLKELFFNVFVYFSDRGVFILDIG